MLSRTDQRIQNALGEKEVRAWSVISHDGEALPSCPLCIFTLLSLWPATFPPHEIFSNYSLNFLKLLFWNSLTPTDVNSDFVTGS